MGSFDNKIVIVTGATRGIGKEIARNFAKEGACVILAGRNEGLATQFEKKLTEQGFKAEAAICDVTNMENVQKMANKVLDKYKRVDILINNAGITKDNLLLRMSEEDWDEVMTVNLKGVFTCTKVFSKAMVKAKQGNIINIASIIGIKGNIGQANYSASKAGIIGFTKSVALEYASRGINVNAVAPGYIETDMTAQLNDKSREDILKNIPVGYFGNAQDVANACLFLASEKARYITGQTIVVDGGMAL